MTMRWSWRAFAKFGSICCFGLALACAFMMPKAVLSFSKITEREEVAR